MLIVSEAEETLQINLLSVSDLRGEIIPTIFGVVFGDQTIYCELSNPYPIIRKHDRLTLPATVTSEDHSAFTQLPPITLNLAGNSRLRV